MKEFWSLLTVAITAYLALALILFVFQRSFLYYPSNQEVTDEELRMEGLRMWPSSDLFHGLTTKEDIADAKGTVVIFHGNAGAAYHRSFYINALSKLKLRTILAEYPGYGGRDGELSEKSLVSDAIETLELAYQQYGAPIYLWGESLGAGVVASAIKKTKTPVKGLILFTPWDSLPEVAQTHYWYLPARWLVKDQYDSVENLKQFNGNVAVVLAENDEVIPLKHGKNLYESLSTNKKLWTFKAAKHNTIPIAPNQNWWEEIIEFVSK